MSRPSATTPHPRWFETYLALEHDEARERPGVVCFVRPDLDQCLTAEVSQRTDGRWAARLLSGPDPDSYIEVTRANMRAAERLASEHSDRLTPQAFFSGSDANPA